MVYEVLSNGKENAMPGRDLVAILELKDLRSLTQNIEQERRAGIPICAAVSGDERGYYLADSPEELEAYLKSLDRRLRNIAETRDACGETLIKMIGQEKMGGC